jgi:hypothetical protein
MVKRRVKAIYGKTRREAAEKLRIFEQQHDAVLVAHTERQTGPHPLAAPDPLESRSTT